MTKNFQRSEFACKCGCGEDRISEATVGKLQRARDIFGSPMTIVSGCRCEVYNKKIGGVTGSAHVPSPTGKAVDIKCTSSRARFRLVQALMEAGFNRIGIGNTFVHVDDDERKNSDCMWDYYKDTHVA